MRETAQPAASCKKILADLHIHTGLSPCASGEMTPPAIVEAAVNRGLSMVAICDHNSSANAAAVQAAAGDSLTVLAGIEITTSEEVHVIGLFPDAVQAQAVCDQVRATLPKTTRAYFKRFGPQAIMDSAGRIVDHEMAMLASASSFNLHEAVKLITAHFGLSIACHIDRPRFSVISQLGVFPRDVSFDAIELSASHAALEPPQGVQGRGRHRCARPAFHSGKSCEVRNNNKSDFGVPDSGLDQRLAAKGMPQRPMRGQDYTALGLPIVTSSDSHFLASVGVGCCVLEVFGRTFSELALALAGVGSRSATARFSNGVREYEIGDWDTGTGEPGPETRNQNPQSRGVRRA